MKNGIPDFEAFQNQARQLLIKGVSPADTEWGNSPSLFTDPSQLRPLVLPKVPKEYMDLAQTVAYANYDDKWNLLYRLAYRLNHETSHLLEIIVDDDVRLANLLYKSVRRDIHKMHAFVRFKKAIIADVETYVAWHKPEHFIIEPGTPFFKRRFGDKPWSIFTPDGSAHWNLKELSFGEGMSQQDFEYKDGFDEVWKTYYKSIFNPARLKIKMMKSEMSPKYWSSLPEAEIIKELIRSTPKQLQNMSETVRFKADVPKGLSWQDLRAQALKCQACPLYKTAHQTVFGEGNLSAKLMIVGEQPGDQEDIQGKAFVGPAGEILAKALAAAGVSRDDIYITNAVKHFKWFGRDEKRIHQKPLGSEMQACKPWLEAEIELLKPKVILTLGNTASTALYGKLLKIKEERGKVNIESHYAKNLMVSWHPSAILRSTSEEEKQARMQDLINDIQMALELL